MSQIIRGEPVGITSEGGYYINLLNKTGGPTVKGYLVHPSSTVDLAFIYCAADEPDIVGVVYEAGIPDGLLCKVVIQGWVDIYSSVAATRGWFIRNRQGGNPGVSGMAYAEALPGSPFATDKHFMEVGHVFQTTGGAGLVRCVCHFN